MNRFAITLLCALLSVSSTTLAHEDHSSRHGGFVMMFLDLHFELVLPAEGGVSLYYSDSIRTPMPAAVVSDVAVEIERMGGSIESVFMQIGDSGEAWEGDSAPVLDAESIVRLAFLFQGEPFVLDIPASVYTNLGVPGHQQPMDHMPMEEGEGEEDKEEMDMKKAMQLRAQLDASPATPGYCTESCAG